jgi:hypothetical protein
MLADILLMISQSDTIAGRGLKTYLQRPHERRHFASRQPPDPLIFCQNFTPAARLGPPKNVLGKSRNRGYCNIITAI